MGFSSRGFKSHSGWLSKASSKRAFSGEYHMYQFISLHSFYYLNDTSYVVNVANDKSKGRNEIWTLDKKVILKIMFESEMKSWPDSSVTYSVWTEFSTHGFESCLGQTSTATSKNDFSGEYHM